MEHLNPAIRSDGGAGSSTQAHYFTPSTSALSPLEQLSVRSRKVQDGMASSHHLNGNAHPDERNRAYQAAFALSRQTSMRNRPRIPSEEHAEQEEIDWDDSRSIDLHGSDTGMGKERVGMGVGSANGSGSSGSNGGRYDQDDRGPRRFQDSATSSSSPSPNVNRDTFLNNAFRSSIASDISFNSISGQTDRQSMAPTPVGDGYQDERDRIIAGSLSLARRDSFDTVRSSEFGDGGRWGRAWANKADDEESIYSRNEWDDDESEGEGHDADPMRLSTLNQTLDGIGPGLGALSHLSARSRSNDREGPQMRSGITNQHVVSLTPSIPPPGTGRTPRSRDSVVTLRGAEDSSQANEEERRRLETQQQIKAQRQRRSLLQQQVSEYGGILSSEAPLASPSLSGGRRDSTATISGASTRSESSGGSGGAHVYVYPPTPGASVENLALRGEGGAQGVSNGWGAEHAALHSAHALMEPQSADVETASIYSRDGSDTASIYSSASEGRDTRDSTGYGSASHPHAPVGPSAFLYNKDSPTSGATRKAGHPGGRPPPPPPPTGGGGGIHDAQMALHDPSRFRGIGPARARAIAEADGRESMVSDLDVETLRLDASSRRGSTSTVSSRMSVGTVAYEPGKGPGARNSGEDFERPRDSWNAGAQRKNDDHRRSSSSSSSGSSKFADAVQTPKFRPAVGSNGQGMQIGSVTSYQPQLAQQTPRAGPALMRSTTGVISSSSAGSIPMAPSASANSISQRSVSAPTAAPASRSAIGTDTRTGPTAAEAFLSQGIDYHEAGELSRSAFYFERSANVEGGCVVGMTMWGMALREGWGARKDQGRGYTWIRRAYERAKSMRDEKGAVRSEKEEAAIRSELKLSMYELGKCYCYGWGVKMDKKEALGLFEEAGQLGDPDAAAEAGALWAAGKGCKKDLRRAAFFYRMAIENGCDAVGLSWVYKPKFL